MKKVLISIFMMLSLTVCNGQNVTQNGNNFTAKETSTDSVKTSYTYTEKGKVYVIYLSSRGKAYIRTSEKKGAKGRKYLPEVGKKINPEAYKED